MRRAEARGFDNAEVPAHFDGAHYALYDGHHPVPIFDNTQRLILWARRRRRLRPDQMLIITVTTRSFIKNSPGASPDKSPCILFSCDTSLYDS